MADITAAPGRSPVEKHMLRDARHQVPPSALALGLSDQEADDLLTATLVEGEPALAS